MRSLKNPATYIKAILGTLIAFVGSLVTASVDGGIAMQEWLVAVLAALVAAGAVYNTPNSKIVDEGPPAVMVQENDETPDVQ